METLKIRFAVAVHPDGRFATAAVDPNRSVEEEDAMRWVMGRFDAPTFGVQPYWIDVELPIPESPIPVHRATVTPIEPNMEG